MRADIAIQPLPGDGTWYLERYARGDDQGTVSADPDCCRGLIAWGCDLAQKGHLDQAEALWQQALVVQPEVHGAHYDMAVAAYRNGDLTAAACELQEELQSGGSVPPELLRRVGSPPWWCFLRSAWLRFWRPLSRITWGLVARDRSTIMKISGKPYRLPAACCWDTPWRWCWAASTWPRSAAPPGDGRRAARLGVPVGRLHVRALAGSAVEAITAT
ncbi:MAG: tetratricopeptide repeat protein [Candidatus Xenobia bacterium]